MYAICVFLTLYQMLTFTVFSILENNRRRQLHFVKKRNDYWKGCGILLETEKVQVSWVFPFYNVSKLLI